MTGLLDDSHLDLVFRALADPTRREILRRLATSGETSVTALTDSFAMSQPAVSKHLKVLEEAGLVSRGRDARFRPCRLETGPLQEAALWLGGYRHFWESSFDNLERYARELLTEEEGQRGKPSRKQR